MREQFRWDQKRVLVTGGAGFIGSHLVESLIARKANITVVDNFSTSSFINLKRATNRINLKQLDIQQLNWRMLLTGNCYDFIFHLAANAYVPPSVEHPMWDYEINLASTVKLLETLRQMNWPGVMINASSAAVYGNSVQIPISEKNSTFPISPYGVGKLAAERYVAVYSQLYGLKIASLRLFSVYGPRQQKQVIYDLIKKIEQNPTELFVYGDGTQVRDFNYVSDTAHAFMLAAERAPAQGEVYNVASGCEYTIGELVQILCSLLEVQPHLIYSGSVRPGDPEKWVVDISKLKSLGYEPQMSFRDGLKQTIAWYKSHTAARSLDYNGSGFVHSAYEQVEL